jgi:5-methylcytosine-specific restriction endonuclease McrA
VAGGINSMIKGIIRLKKYSISDVFDHFDASPRSGQMINFHGYKMCIRNNRIANFRINGVACVNCGTKGAFFALEKQGHDTSPHLNLYGFKKNGKDLLMTRDHIKPKAKGGTNKIYNMQPMCLICNSEKSDKWSFKYKLKYYLKKIKYLIGTEIFNAKIFKTKRQP